MSAASNILTVRYVPCAALFHLLAIFATHCHPPSLEVIQLKAKNKKITQLSQLETTQLYWQNILNNLFQTFKNRNT